MRMLSWPERRTLVAILACELSGASADERPAPLIPRPVATRLRPMASRMVQVTLDIMKNLPAAATRARSPRRKG